MDNGNQTTDARLDISETQCYKALLELNNAIVTNLTQEDLLGAVCSALQKVIPFDGAGISLYEPSLDALRFSAMAGFFKSTRFDGGLVLDRKDSASGQAFDLGEPVFRRDLEREQQYSSETHLFAEGIRSICVAPLIVNRKSIGTLNLASTRANQYSQHDATLLQEVANQVALVVANMRSFEEISKLSARESALAARRQTLLDITNAIILTRTREELLTAIYESLHRILRFDQFGISLYEHDIDALRYFAMHGGYKSDHFVVGRILRIEDSISGRAFTTQQRVLRRDLEIEREFTPEHEAYAEGIRSLLTVPLIAQGRSLGAIGGGSKTPGQYSDEDAEFLSEIAAQVAMAVANVRAYEDIASISAKQAAMAERRRALLEVNNAIITNLSQQALLSAIFPALQRVLLFDRVALSAYEPEVDGYRILAIEGRSRSDNFFVGQLIGNQDHYVTEEFDFERPLVLPDLEHTRQNLFEQSLYESGVRSFCAVPLLMPGRRLGSLSISSETPNQYSRNEAEFLQEVGNQVALALANMQAFEEIAALKTQLQDENIYLQEEIRREHNFEQIVGNSAVLLDVLDKVESIAATDSTVLILGETGTGKELIARGIHDRSPRKNRPLVKVNCGAISSGLVESELFGHVKGAFTGAIDKRVGRFELADGGTLFLDEVGELPNETQVKLLRVLQEGEFEPLGSNRTIKVSVRIIAATNRDLEQAVKHGQFRSDLFYRLNVLPVTVPPLRARRADIPQLVMYFIERFSKQFNRPVPGVTRETMDLLSTYSWPGNIRELQNVMERCLVLCKGPALSLGPDLLPLPAIPKGVSEEVLTGSNNNGSLKESSIAETGSLEEVERHHILQVLERTGWVIEGAKGAAKILNIHPNTLRSRLKKLGIRR